MNETSDRVAGSNKAHPLEAMAKRERLWEECGIEEKVERLRMALMRARETAQYAAKNASAANELAERHQHNPATGEVLRPAQRHGGAESSGSGYDPLR